MNKSFVLANKIVNIELFFSLLMKKLEFRTITKVQLIESIVINPLKEPSVLFSPKYFSSVKYKINLLYSPVAKIKINKTGPDI